MLSWRQIVILLPVSLLLLAGNLAAEQPSSSTLEVEDCSQSFHALQVPAADDSKIYLGPCTATLDCGDEVISCSGNSTCEANEAGGYVECDGNRTTCPNRCEVSVLCICECSENIIQCSSNVGNCQKTNDSVTCEGVTITCSMACFGVCRPGPSP